MALKIKQLFKKFPYNDVMRIKYLILFLSLWLLAAAPPVPFVGQVVAVQQGDTLTVQSGDRAYKVRLLDIDAPELDQPFGKEARRFTEKMALGFTVRVDVRMTDRFGRRIGTVIIEDGRILNEELVHAGLAWYYRASPYQNPRMQKLEQGAYASRLGLWLQDKPLPPWEFRRESHIPAVPASTAEVDYDRIFHYGLIGSFTRKTFRWPECRLYRVRRPKKAMIFHSLEQARQLGFRPAKDCPK